MKKGPGEIDQWLRAFAAALAEDPGLGRGCGNHFSRNDRQTARKSMEIAHHCSGNMYQNAMRSCFLSEPLYFPIRKLILTSAFGSVFHVQHRTEQVQNNWVIL